MSSSSLTPRAPLLPWTSQSWNIWSTRPRLSLTPVPKTTFLHLKVPISQLYLDLGNKNDDDDDKTSDNYTAKAIFTVQMYMDRCFGMKIRVGLVIDCTEYDVFLYHNSPTSNQSTTSTNNNNTSKPNTNRFYFHDPTEWDQFDCEYLVLPSPTSPPLTTHLQGRFYIPTLSTVGLFIDKVTTFSRQNPLCSISIFDCFFTTAPFLIASYLITVMKADVNQAIELAGFPYTTKSADNKAVNRKDTIYVQALIQELYNRYDGSSSNNRDNRGRVFEKPYWVGEKGVELSLTSASSSTSTVVPVPMSVQSSLSSSSSSVTVTLPLLEECPPSNMAYGRVRSVVLEMIAAVTKPNNSIETTNSSNFYFPFSSICRNKVSNLQDIRVNNNTSSMSSYLVSWIPKGRRGLLLVLKNEGVFFVEEVIRGDESDTQNNTRVFKIKDLQIPVHQDTATSSSNNLPPPTPPETQQHRTLLDVMLVTEGGVPKLLVLDIIALNGGILTSKGYESRLSYIRSFVMKPVFEGIERRRKQPCISLRLREAYDSSKLVSLKQKVLANLKHDYTGIAFIRKDGRFDFSGDANTDLSSFYFYLSSGKIGNNDGDLDFVALEKEVTQM